MTRAEKIALGRLDIYLDRTKKALRKGDRYQAAADCAELGEIARRLWKRLTGIGAL